MDEDPVGKWPLHFAAMEGDLVWLQEELARGRPVNEFDDTGYTPLHWAVVENNDQAVRLLLAAGADVNAHDERVIGDTPLGQAANECTLRMARILVEAGADPTIPGWMQLTALSRALKRQDPEGPAVVELLRAVGRNRGA